MFSLIFFGIAFGVFIWGVILVTQGLKQKIDDYEAVPISNIHEVENIGKAEEKKLTIEEEVKTSLPEKAKSDEAQEDVRDTLPTVDHVGEKKYEKIIGDLEERSKQQEDLFREKMENLQKENNELKSALEREMVQHHKQGNRGDIEEQVQKLEIAEESIKALTEENYQLKNKAKDENQEGMVAQGQKLAIAGESIKALTEENDQLKGEISQLTSDHSSLTRQIDGFVKEKNVYDNERVSFLESQQRVKAMEAEIQRHKTDSQEVEQLQGQVRDLAAREHGYIERAKNLEQQVGQLKNRPVQAEKSNEEADQKLKVQIQDVRLHLKRLEKERDTIKAEKQEMEKDLINKLDYANESIRLLKLQDQNQNGDIARKLAKHEDGSMFPIVDLKNENKRLLKDKVQLEKYYQELKEFNSRLVEKERILHYELTKSRAQNLGLENICEELKVQIEAVDASLAK